MSVTIVSIILTVFFAMLLELRKPKAVKPGELQDLKMPGIVRWVGYLSIVFSVFLLWAGSLQDNPGPQDFGLMWGGFVLFLLMGLFVIAMTKNHRIILYSGLFTAVSPFGKTHDFTREEVVKIQTIPWVNFYRIKLSSGTVLYLSIYISGIEKVVEDLRAEIKRRK